MNDEKNLIFTVTACNNYIKDILESNNVLKSITIKGEVSNAKIYGNGNMYFSLKDDNAAISAVIFNNYLNKIPTLPKDGDQIVVIGSISVFAARGTYQIRVYELYFDGAGRLYAELEKLKAKLASEGLFDQSKKRKLNLYPDNIGLITAYPSAAAEDLIKNIHRRYPIANIYVFPSLVQGSSAANELIKTLDLAYGYKLDTLILARGGGSIEDLWCFNDENLVRKFASSPIPTISAIGHEIDFTLCDFVADVRASTPTAAAELSTINQDDIRFRLQDYYNTLEYSLKNKISVYRNQLDICKNNQFFKNQLSFINMKKDELKLYQTKLNASLTNSLTKYKHLINLYKEKLDAMSPYKVLDRGYSISTNQKGEIIKSINDINNNDIIKTTLKDGIIISKVEEKETK